MGGGGDAVAVAVAVDTWHMEYIFTYETNRKYFNSIWGWHSDQSQWVWWFCWILNLWLWNVWEICRENKDAKHLAMFRLRACSMFQRSTRHMYVHINTSMQIPLDTYKQVYHQTEIRLNYAMLQFARDFSHLCEVLLKYEQYFVHLSNISCKTNT